MVRLSTRARLTARPLGRNVAAAMLVGVSGVDITPDRPLQLEGYGDREQPATGTLDPADAPAAAGTLGARTLPRADPIALLFSCVCHPTMLRAENRRYSGDYPGAARRFVEGGYGSSGTRALFLPGCFGNVRPDLRD